MKKGSLAQLNTEDVSHTQVFGDSLSYPNLVMAQLLGWELFMMVTVIIFIHITITNGKGTLCHYSIGNNVIHLH